MRNQSQGYEFLNQSPEYLAGVQVGTLLMRMQHGDERVIETLVYSEILDEVALMASRLGWVVKRSYGEDGCGVVYLRMRRCRQRRGRKGCPVHH